MNPANNNTTCPQCGNTYPGGDLGGFGGMCPRCLLGGSLVEADAVGEEEAGKVIGRYQLVEKIGSGGMGTVWRARQTEPVEREVAVKIIKVGMDTSEVVSRFQAEQQTLAAMDHPHVAKVLEAGATEEGRPYFAMELIGGVPITDFCAVEALDLRSRLDLFVQLCSAIEHAHQKGVIHRDLKPSNVLVTEVDGAPQVKVIDFGVAKATAGEPGAQTLFTRLGQVIGTPSYMSPEQAGAAADIDVRSDVYSLGVLLYELLTGVPPHDPKRLISVGVGEMQRIIREEDPPKPSTRVDGRRGQSPAATGLGKTTSLRGDLDWITVKALEKDRERRYGSAAALADDIRRFFRHEPVTAAAPTAGYRLRKFCRKNRGAVLAGGALFATLVLGGALTAWQVVRATRNAERAERLATSEQRAKIRALQTVSDSYRNSGVVAAEDGDAASAALWFNAAAEQAREAGDGPRVRANTLRAALFGRAAPVPVASFPPARALNASLFRFDAADRFLVLMDFDHRKSQLDSHVADLHTGNLLEFGTGKAKFDAAAIHPDGQWAALSREPGKVEIRPVAGGPPVREIVLPGDPAPVDILLYRDDGKYLLIGSRPARLWDVGNSEFVGGSLAVDRRLIHATFSADGSHLLTLGFVSPAASDPLRGHVRIYPVPVPGGGDGESPPLFEPALMRDNDLIVIAGMPHFVGDEKTFSIRQGEDIIMQLRLVATGEAVQTMPGKHHQVLSPDAERVFKMGECLAVADGSTLWRTSARRMSVSPDGTEVLADDGTILDTADGELRHRLWPKPSWNVVISDDGTLAADRTTVWSLARPLPVRRILNPSAGFISFSHDGRFVAPAGTAFTSTHTTRAYDCDTGLPAGPPVGEPGWLLRHCDFSPAGTRIAIASTRTPRDGWTSPDGDGAIHLWDWESGEAAGGPFPMPGEPRAVRYHPDGTWLGVMCATGEVVRVDLPGGEMRALFKTDRSKYVGHPGTNGSLEFSPDGNSIYAWGVGLEVHVWDIADGAHRFDPIVRRFRPLRVAEGGGVLLVNDVGHGEVFDATTGESLSTDFGPGRLSSFGSRLSRDGNTVYWANNADATQRPAEVAALDWRSGEIVGTPIGLTGVKRPLVEPVPGTPWLVVGGAGDGQGIGFYDQRTGRPLCPPVDLGGEASDMQVSPGGRYLAACTERGSVLIIDLLAWFDAGTHAVLDPDARRLIAEINAQATIAGGSLQRLSMQEWDQRWARYRETLPDHRRLKPEPGELERWYRNRAADPQASGFARRWNLERAVNAK